MRCDERANSTEEDGITATAEFAGNCGRLHDQQGRGERGDKANAAQGVAKHGAADMDQEWDERGLVNVSPGEVIAAGHVIELVAKVAIAVVEVNVEEQFDQGDRPNQCHAV